SDPKPGNVDREHDHDDTNLHHFLSGAVGARGSLEDAARGRRSVGEAIHGCARGASFHSGGNTQFGAFVLLVPLVTASETNQGRDSLIRRAERVVDGTTTDDALRFYDCFDVVDVYTGSTDVLDVNDPESRRRIEDEGLTLRDVMERGTEEDGVAREWATGFERCREAAELLDEEYDVEVENPTNRAVATTYAELLADEPDGFVAKKHGEGVAEEVRRRTREALDSEDRLDALRELDDELVNRGINPGTTADITAAGIFVNLWCENSTEGFGI
ncbi:MAG: triphosphoribosyl-dephospho-CoA synthase, partial [Halobacteria archaeon]|nr:triphosphoribosyl-dephospho-CoA synthase [Halobacteria archaeon]